MGRDWQVESGTEEKRKWELGDKGRENGIKKWELLGGMRVENGAGREEGAKGWKLGDKFD